MRHIIAALFLLLGATMMCPAQKHRLPVKVDSIKVQPVIPGNFIRYSNNLITYKTISIKNDSTENFYFWIGHNPTDIMDDDRMLMSKYFRWSPLHSIDKKHYISNDSALFKNLITNEIDTLHFHDTVTFQNPMTGTTDSIDMCNYPERFAFWIWDQNVNLDDIHSIGYSFLKLLKPGDQFTVIVPDDDRLLKYYLERFVFVSEEIVQVRIGVIPDKFLYKSDAIVLQPINAIKQPSVSQFHTQ